MFSSVFPLGNLFSLQLFRKPRFSEMYMRIDVFYHPVRLNLWPAVFTDEDRDLCPLSQPWPLGLTLHLWLQKLSRKPGQMFFVGSCLRFPGDGGLPNTGLSFWYAGAIPRRVHADAEAVPHRGVHAEALQLRLWGLLQRRHLLPVCGHASHHAREWETHTLSHFLV